MACRRSSVGLASGSGHRHWGGACSKPGRLQSIAYTTRCGKKTPSNEGDGTAQFIIVSSSCHSWLTGILNLTLYPQVYPPSLWIMAAFWLGVLWSTMQRKFSVSLMRVSVKFRTPPKGTHSPSIARFSSSGSEIPASPFKVSGFIPRTGFVAGGGAFPCGKS